MNEPGEILNESVITEQKFKFTDDFRKKVLSYRDPDSEKRKHLLEKYDQSPNNDGVWGEAYMRARQEEQAGLVEWSEFDDIPAQDLIEISKKVRALPNYQDRYRLMAEKAPNGKIWFDALTGFSSPEVEYGIDQHLSSTLKKRGQTSFEVGLDIGCGTGRVSEILALHCKKTTGLDISDALLAVAQARSKGGINYVRGDVTKLPFKDGEIDVITSLGLMGALNADQQTDLLTEISRVLKDGGMFVVGYNKPDNIQNTLIELSWKNTLADMITDVVSGRSQIARYLNGHEMDKLTGRLGLARSRYEYSWVKGADILTYNKDRKMLAQERSGYDLRRSD